MIILNHRGTEKCHGKIRFVHCRTGATIYSHKQPTFDLRLIPKELNKRSVLLEKLIPTNVVSFEVRIILSCNSRIVSANFSCAIMKA